MTEQTEIELTRVQDAEIAEFWRKHGRSLASMIAQPLKRDGKYMLRIKMLNPDQAESINDLLSKLGVTEPPTK